ncbi:MAG: hypothetical protein EO766_00800 [Hydrotalea sp. AMD]|uniref:hypothetical protein n=1 Tax=Hydrotalea sp. AMD TaxID=2501297 RepID=UPI000944F4AB|nr:hypothetical protein [Hydrotalea sp. AMD]RWZ90732.1 MAG: hypothetical protein EO766_00800 [Hydrotalea sp. AMD]
MMLTKTKIAYTVCSANHLAYAKTMADSLLSVAPEYTVIIGLVDRINGRFSVAEFLPHEVMEVEQIAVPEFDNMSRQYTLIELNCAMKPFLAQYIFASKKPDILLYIDADIFFYHSISIIEEVLEQLPIIITPHFFTPINDEALPMERDVLRSGIYNAGFIALKNNAITHSFLQWWAERLKNQCYYNFAEGMAVDQNWLNLVPLFFDKVAVLQHKGYNVAYWNLHERKLSIRNNTVWVNDTEPLIFLHISGYKFETPEILSKHQTRFQLGNLPVLKNLLADYRQLVYQNGYSQFIQMPCYFAKPVKKSTGIMAFVNKILLPLRIKITNA